jgi:hypothetical protein
VPGAAPQPRRSPSILLRGRPDFCDVAFFKGKLDRFIDSTGKRYTLTELETREGSLLPT